MADKKLLSPTILHIKPKKMTLSELNKNYSFHDSTLETITYDKGKKTLSMRIDFCTFERPVFNENSPDVVPISLVFNGVKEYSGLTGSPKTECGRELKALSGVLWKTNRTDFEARFKALKHRYADFLKERNENRQFKHRRLRSAFRSIDRNMPDMFTWQENPGLNIPNTTNTCEGYFRQIKTRLRVHSGLKRERLKKVIERLFIGR